MITYEQWNQALLSFFLEGRPRGSMIYLAVDDEVIQQVGRELGISADRALPDFRHAVRLHVVSSKGGVRCHQLAGRDPQGDPKHVAFLALTVLAASWMDDDEAISPQNYFKRLRQALGFPVADGGRPEGFDIGCEEPLWEDWARWLQEQGYLPSADRGKGRYGKYINYPVSQTLLRRIDRGRLRGLFRERQWQQLWDPETLMAMVQQEADTLGLHLRRLLHSRGGRYEAITAAIYEEYERWLEGEDEYGLNLPVRATQSRLLAGLLRTEDRRSSLPQYYLYPQQPRRETAEPVQVRIGQTVHTLCPERPGWFYPLPVTLDETLLNQEQRYPIEGSPSLTSLVLPQRLFWILVPDPENPDFGDYATWGAPSLNTSFLILCHSSLLPQLQTLRDERLLQWEGEAQTVFSSGAWVELRNCMVVSATWSGVFIENRALHEALQPRRMLSVNLSGGLRVPNGRGWIEGYGPKITVGGFCQEAEVRIVRVTEVEEKEVLGGADSARPANQPFSFDWPGPGTYRVDAMYGDETARRLVNIVAWEQIDSAQAEIRVGGELIEIRQDGLTIRGALIRDEWKVD